MMVRVLAGAAKGLGTQTVAEQVVQRAACSVAEEARIKKRASAVINLVKAWADDEHRLLVKGQKEKGGAMEWRITPAGRVGA